MQHDQPLPKHLLMSSSTGRYHPVLCKKAASKVSELIKSLSVFCLLENHSYISFIKNEQGHPTSFYVIRVTSKPPCLVVWVAFLGGIIGSERHAIVSELTAQLRQLTMRQTVTWRDLPPGKMKPRKQETDETNKLDSPSRSQVSSASQFPDVYSCLILNKPVEKILVRYEKVPSDYCSLLEPLNGRSRSPVAGQKDEKMKNATAAFLTLSRYLNHQRWIFSLQNSASTSISPESVSRILSTVSRARIQEGFTFAHSSRGIQNMVLEVPMNPEDGNTRETAPQSCIIQYIIFPPHITTTSSVDGLSEDDFYTGSNKDDASVEAEGELQIILEVWSEPQDGVVSVDDPHSNLCGKKSREITSSFYPKDVETVSTLITFEHLIMMCQNPCVPSPLSQSFSHSHILPVQELQSSLQLPAVSDKNSIQQVPFAFDLLNLLPKAHQTEMIFSLLLQDLTSVIPETAFSLYSTLKSIADRPNEMLFENFVEELTDASDRELSLSNIDNDKLPELIRKRQISNFQLQQHRPTERQSFRSSHPSTNLPRTGSSAKRFPSGNSASSSLADTYRDLQSQQDCSNCESICTSPKWKCFLKAVSPTHMILTLVPASYEDLKLLLVNDDTLHGNHPDIVDVVKKGMPTEYTNDIVGSLDDISINSSIPNLEMVNREALSDNKSPRLDLSQTFNRQRSGSDVFEMNRPKLPTARKTSGDPAVMRDRTVSLDGLSQFRAKALLRKKIREAKEKEKTDCSDSKIIDSSEIPKSRCRGRISQEENIQPSEFLQSSSPQMGSSSRKVVGSLSFPVYIYDCNILGLTNNLIYKEGFEKPKNHHLNYLFKPEKKSEREADGITGINKTPDLETGDSNSHGNHTDKDVKHWYKVMKMIYYKSFVTVLFRSLQLKLPIHSYDIQHAIDYCDADSSCDLELEAFVKAVCPHLNTNLNEDKQKIDVDEIKAGISCFKQESWHKSVQKKFSEIVGNKFKLVPGMKDVYFFCPPGLELGEVIRVGSRHRNETKSSENTSRPFTSDKHRGDDDDDKTIEFRSNVSNESLKFNKFGSVTETEIETGQRDIQSSFSSASHFEQEWDSDDEYREADEFSPPLFIQFSFSLSQKKEDIISVPVNYLPSCLCEIFQDKNIPDPEQDLFSDVLGLRIDIVCMTIPFEMKNILEIIGGLRSTSLCSSMSCRDSRSVPDDDFDIDDTRGEDADPDNLSHLPSYQHKAVLDIKDELNWMLMDEIAFALCKSSELSHQTLDFVTKHVQASTRERPGSFVESIDLEFVFGSEKSIDKFKEQFNGVSLNGYLLKQEAEFYYLGKKYIKIEKIFYTDQYEKDFNS